MPLYFCSGILDGPSGSGVVSGWRGGSILRGITTLGCLRTCISFSILSIPEIILVHQCIYELTNTSLFLVDISSLYSTLVFVPCIETVLSVMIHYRTRHIPVSHVSICKLVPGIPPCQHINTLVHTNYIPRVSACQNVSIMTCVINV